MEVLVSEFGVFLYRLTIAIVADFLFWTVCYWLGWPLCKLVSGGRYPASSPHHGRKHNGHFCALSGLAIIMCVFALLVAYA